METGLTMDRLFNWEQMRIIFVSAASPILAFLTPTKGFIFALIVMFAFNIWCGMRADGVAIVRCKNFSFRKFKNALAEFLFYILICQTVYTTMVLCGDKDESLIALKSLTYVFMYVYLQNACKNLTIAYPTNKAFRIIYHLIRLEFPRALPSRVRTLVNRIEKEMEDKKQKESNETDNNNR